MKDSPIYVHDSGANDGKWTVYTPPSDRQEAIKLLEESQLQWKRDWDAVAVGFMLGVLATLAVQGVW